MVNRTSLILDRQCKKFYNAIVWPMACNSWVLHITITCFLTFKNSKEKTKEIDV